MELRKWAAEGVAFLALDADVKVNIILLDFPGTGSIWI
jgi:hypothetical protein